MLRPFLAVLAASTALSALPSYAQDGEAGLNRIRSTLLDMGVVLITPNAQVSGDSVALPALRLAPKPGSGAAWGVTLGDTQLRAEPGGWLSARPEGDVTLALGTPGTPQHRTWTMQAPGLEMRLGPETEGEGVAGWSLEAPDARVAWAHPDSAGQVDVKGLRYEGRETDRAHAEHRVRATRAGGQAQWIAGRSARGVDVQLVGVDGELALQSGGYLETYPWMAAIGAGMEAQARIEWREGGMRWGGVRPAGGGLDVARTIGLGGFSWKAQQDREGLETRWSLADGQWLDSRMPSAVEIRLDGASGHLDVPLHASATPLPMSLGWDIMGEVEKAGRKWGIDTSAAATGTAQLPVDWFAYNAAQDRGSWRSFGAVFEPRAIDVDIASLLVDGKGVEVSGAGAVGEERLGGAWTVRSTGTLGLLDMVGQSGLFSIFASNTVVGGLRTIFGEDAGASAKEMVLDGGQIWSRW